MTGAALFCAAAVLALPAVLLLMQVAGRTGFVAHPNPLIATHRAPVPYLGGLAVCLAAIAALALGSAVLPLDIATKPALRPLIAALPLLGVGIADDGFVFAPPAKFGLQFAAAAIGALAYFPLASPEWLLATLWVVAIVNAVNFLDVSDGFAGGIMMVTLLGFALLMDDGQPALLAAAGACLGFLFFNRPPARIYLGDAGSHFLGAMAAFVALVPHGRSDESWSAFVLSNGLLLGVALFELVFVTAVRLRKKIPFWRGSRDHVALRLQAGRLSRGQTALVGAGAQAVLVGAALGVAHTRGWAAHAAIAAAILLLAVVAAWQLLRWEPQSA